MVGVNFGKHLQLFGHCFYDGRHQVFFRGHVHGRLDTFFRRVMFFNTGGATRNFGGLYVEGHILRVVTITHFICVCVRGCVGGGVLALLFFLEVGTVVNGGFRSFGCSFVRLVSPGLGFLLGCDCFGTVFGLSTVCVPYFSFSASYEQVVFAPPGVTAMSTTVLPGIHFLNSN